MKCWGDEIFKISCPTETSETITKTYKIKITDVQEDSTAPTGSVTYSTTNPTN